MIRTTVFVQNIEKFNVRSYNALGGEVSHGSVIICPRFEGKPLALIEDVWTREDCRKQGLATDIINELIKIARIHDCYKAILNCNDNNVPFYTKLGFILNDHEMRMDL